MRWLRKKQWKEEKRGLKYFIWMNTIVNTFLFSYMKIRVLIPTYTLPPVHCHLVGTLWVTALVPRVNLSLTPQQASAHQWACRTCSSWGGLPHSFSPYPTACTLRRHEGKQAIIAETHLIESTRPQSKWQRLHRQSTPFPLLWSKPNTVNLGNHPPTGTSQVGPEIQICSL